LKTVQPGLHVVNPCTDKLFTKEMRIKVLDLPRSSFLTKDNVSIHVDAAVYYRLTISFFFSFFKWNFLFVFNKNRIVTARYAHYRIKYIN